MEVNATAKYLRVSPRKARMVIDMIKVMIILLNQLINRY